MGIVYVDIFVIGVVGSTSGGKWECEKEFWIGVRGGVVKNWLTSVSETVVVGDGNSDGVKRGDRKGKNVL